MNPLVFFFSVSPVAGLEAFGCASQKSEGRLIRRAGVRRFRLPDSAAIGGQAANVGRKACLHILLIFLSSFYILNVFLRSIVGTTIRRKLTPKPPNSAELCFAYRHWVTQAVRHSVGRSDGWSNARQQAVVYIALAIDRFDGWIWSHLPYSGPFSMISFHFFAQPLSDFA